jgi:hypothetical protein
MVRAVERGGMKRTRLILLLAVIVGIAIVVWTRPWANAKHDASRPLATANTNANATANATATANASAPPSAPPTAMATAPAKRDFVTMKWGSGPNEIGRKRPQEGNPEGPMSLAIDPRGNTLVLDQVNGRIVRLGPDGASAGVLKVGDGAQDVAVGRDGTVAVLDRLVDKNVTLYGADGRPIGSLSLEGKGITEAGQITGVFVDGDSVFVEREHGQLVRLGDTRGANGERDEIPGRPTRDGSAFISAFVDSGRVLLSATSRATMQHKYTRALAMAGTMRGILLLDSDRYSTVYVASIGTASDGTESEWLACVALEDGHVLGVVAVPPNVLPEETFREFAVEDDGGVLHAELGDDGVRYVRYDCR